MSILKDKIQHLKFRTMTAVRPCYAICTEDTTDMFSAVKKLIDGGLLAKTHVVAGDVFGYVFCNKDELQKANSVADKNGFWISDKPMDAMTAMLIR